MPTMPNMIPRVFEFNSQVVGIPIRALEALPSEEKRWLIGVLMEEAKELEEAASLPDMVDALIDSVVFAIGGLYRLGLTPDQAEACFHAVMDANFQKRSGQKPGRSFEGVADAVKPPGWKDPKFLINEILWLT
jgi:hypothetical protein